MSTTTHEVACKRARLAVEVFTELHTIVAADFPAATVYASISDVAHRAKVSARYKHTGRGTSVIAKLTDGFDIDSQYLPDPVRSFLSANLTLTADEALAVQNTDPALYAAWIAAKKTVSAYRKALRDLATAEPGITDPATLFATFQRDAEAFFAKLDAEAAKPEATA